MSKRSHNATSNDESGKRQRTDSIPRLASQPDAATTRASTSTRRSRVVTLIPTRRGAVRSSAMDERVLLSTSHQPATAPTTSQQPTMLQQSTTPQHDNVANLHQITTEVPSSTKVSSTGPAQVTTAKPKRQRDSAHVCSWSHSYWRDINDQRFCRQNSRNGLS